MTLSTGPLTLTQQDLKGLSWDQHIHIWKVPLTCCSALAFSMSCQRLQESDQGPAPWEGTSGLADPWARVTQIAAQCPGISEHHSARQAGYCNDQ